MCYENLCKLYPYIVEAVDWSDSGLELGQRVKFGYDQPDHTELCDASVFQLRLL